MFKTLFFHKNVYYTATLAALLFVISYLVPFFYTIAQLLLVLTLIALVVDVLIIYSQRKGINASRQLADRFSLGDANKISLEIFNRYGFPVTILVVDEMPLQFQMRNWSRKLKLEKNNSETIHYFLTPVARGIYEFGSINIMVTGPLKLAQRQYMIDARKQVAVYPSYIQMRRYQLLATGNHLQQSGMKRIKRLGHSMEFEQIKEYVRGDDYRTINWKATARKRDLMVNNYTDERSQQVYCIINKGRLMKMPFEGMSLLDYAINASLVLSNVVIGKQDKAGLVTFADKVDTFISADKKATQMNLLLESLYREETNFMEAGYENLYAAIRKKITHRSLLVLFTNFETMEGLERELPLLKMMSRYHLLLVILFQNTELEMLTESKARTTSDIYIKTIAAKYQHEKKLISKELQANGILTLLTRPASLTINVLNKYLEIKGRNSV